MKPLLISLILLGLVAVVAPAAIRPAAAEESSPEEDAYFEFRQWVNAQPEEIGEGNVLAAYREYLAAQGYDGKQID